MSLSFTNQGKKVKMTIEEYTFTLAHKGRRGSPRVNPGTKVYVLKYEGGRGYYTYSYLNREDAEAVIKNGVFYGTDNEYYCEWNRVDSPEKTMHVGYVAWPCMLGVDK